MMKTKKNLALLLAFLLVVGSMVACSSQNSPNNSNDTSTPSSDSNNDTSSTPDNSSTEPIYIGISAGITGSAPSEGESMVNTITLAVEQINAAGGVLGGRQIELVVEDDQYTTDGAINAVNKLIAHGKLSAIIGPHRSNLVIATDTLIADAGIPILTGGSSTTFYELENDYIFRIRASDSVVTQIAAKYVVEECDPTVVGMMYISSDYGTSAEKSIREYMENAGVEFVSEAFNSGDVDMTGQILTMKNAGVDVLIGWGDGQEATVIARQLHELDYHPMVIGSAGFSNPTFLDSCEEEYANGIYSFAEFSSLTKTEIVQDFLKAYEKRFGVAADAHAGIYYNTAFLLADAIERAGSSDPEAIRDALTQTKDFNSTIGYLTTDERNDMVHNMTLFVNDGLLPTPLKTFYEDGYGEP